MGFFDRLKNGWRITMASLGVVRQDPEFLLLPVLSGLILLGILASFFVSMPADGVSDLALYGFIGIFYFISYTLLFFSQAMILDAARMRFSGQNPTLGNTVGVARKHFGKILLLALISSVVSIVSAALRDKGRKEGNFLTAILGSLLGASWAVISYFSLPVILYENVGVMDSFKRSFELFKKTWGETATAGFSTIVLFAPGFVILLLAILIGVGLRSVSLAMGVGALGVLILIAGAVVSAMVKPVIAQALYEYAATGKVPQAMPSDAIQGAYGST